MLLGGGILVMAAVLSGSDHIPEQSMIWPQKLDRRLSKLTFLLVKGSFSSLNMMKYLINPFVMFSCVDSGKTC